MVDYLRLPLNPNSSPTLAHISDFVAAHLKKGSDFEYNVGWRSTSLIKRSVVFLSLHGNDNILYYMKDK